MRRLPLCPVLWLLAACSSPERRGDEAEELRSERARAQQRAVDRSYLTARREERSCKQLQDAADTAFTQGAHGPALDAAELVMAYCPAARLGAVEQTQVILARSEARSGGPTGRAVRLRLALPLPAGYRLLWAGAFVDRKLGLNNLSVGNHRVELELHVWQRGRDRDQPGSGQMLRVAGAIDVAIDGRTPVLLDAVVGGGETAGAPAALVPLAVTLTPTRTALPPGATTGLAVEGGRPTAPAQLARTRIPFPDPPEPLARVGIPQSVDLELCFDAAGRVSRVDALAWPHPRFLASYIEGLRAFRTRPFVQNGVPVPFCTGWRQIVEAPAVSSSR